MPPASALSTEGVALLQELWEGTRTTLVTELNYGDVAEDNAICWLLL
jgi:hypothetical protein